MKLAIMTKSTFFVEEDKILTTLFEAGLDSLHLYKPNSSPIYSERLLSLLPDNTYNKITVHGHFYLKDEYRLAGIHLDSTSEKAPENYKGNASITCRTMSDVKEFKKQAKYIFMGNIFQSLSSPFEQADFDMATLEQASQSGIIDKKVYAMGGMNYDNIQIAKDLGFGGVVICGDLWNRFDIHNQMDYKELINHFERLKKSVY